MDGTVKHTAQQRAKKEDVLKNGCYFGVAVTLGGPLLSELYGNTEKHIILEKRINTVTGHPK